VRSDGVIRALAMIQLLSGGRRRSLDELAEHFHITTRTVRRDLEVLSVAGVPVRSTKDTPANGCTTYWWVER
jgi:predicted DNA-binding transcriptional regulator YafY